MTDNDDKNVDDFFDIGDRLVQGMKLSLILLSPKLKLCHSYNHPAYDQ